MPVKRKGQKRLDPRLSILDHSAITGVEDSMRTAFYRSLTSAGACIIALYMLGCGAKVESEAGLQAMAMLNEYEIIVDRYEYKFKDNASSSSEYAQLVNELSADIQDWFDKWDNTDINIDPSEMKSLRKRLDAINARARKMLEKHQRELRGERAVEHFGRNISDL